MDKHWTDLLPSVVDALKKGPKSLGEVVTEVRTSKYRKRDRITERILGALIEAKLIEKSESGIYMWIKDYQEFETKEMYGIKLKHSKKLLEGALGEGDFDNYTIHIYHVMKNKNFNYLLQHLETGYPDTYKYWLTMKFELSSMAKGFWKLYDEAEKFAEEKGYSFNPIRLVFPEWSYEGGMKLEEDVQTFLEICCTSPKDIFKNLANLMNYLISDKHFEFFARDVPEHIHRHYKELFKRHDIFDKLG